MTPERLATAKQLPDDNLPFGSKDGELVRRADGSYWIYRFSDWELTGPSERGAKIKELRERAYKIRKEMDLAARALEREADGLIHSCKHKFDDGRCSTQNLHYMDSCVICGR